MKKILTILLLLQSTFLFSQNLHYFRLNIGPKFEKYNVTGNDNVSALFHMDAGASVYLGKRFTENIYAEVGLLKNDYSAKFDVITKNDLGTEYRWFDEDLYPTFSSTQLALNVGWRQPYSQKVSFYGSAGLQTFLSRKRVREGSQEHVRQSVIEVDGEFEDFTMYTFSNDLEAGSIILRTDVGTLIQVSKTLCLDLGFTARAGTNTLNEFQIEYTSSSDDVPKRATLSTSGAGIILNIGVKYQVNKFSN